MSELELNITIIRPAGLTRLVSVCFTTSFAPSWLGTTAFSGRELSPLVGLRPDRILRDRVVVIRTASSQP